MKKQATKLTRAEREAKEARRFIRETRKRYSKETQAAMRQSIVRSYWDMPEDFRADYEWLKKTFPNCIELCPACQAWVARQDALETQGYGTRAITRWPIFLKDAVAFHEYPENEGHEFDHYDSRLDILVPGHD